MDVLIAWAVVIFLAGFGIGMAVFSKSKARIFFAGVCGFVAVIVAIAVLFVGCVMSLKI